MCGIRLPTVLSRWVLGSWRSYYPHDKGKTATMQAGLLPHTCVHPSLCPAESQGHFGEMSTIWLVMMAGTILKYRFQYFENSAFWESVLTPKYRFLNVNVYIIWSHKLNGHPSRHLVNFTVRIGPEYRNHNCWYQPWYYLFILKESSRTQQSNISHLTSP